MTSTTIQFIATKLYRVIEYSARLDRLKFRTGASTNTSESKHSLKHPIK